jgi:hypothetical protein
MSFLAAFVLALLISLLFLPSYKSRSSPLAPLVIFFFILLMAGLAAQFWILPFGPVLLGVAWLPLLFILVIVTFLFAIPSPYQTAKAKEEQNIVAINIFSWLILFVLFIALAIGYYTSTSS